MFFSKYFAMFSHIVKQIREIFGKNEGFIPLHEPKFVGNERKYVLDAIDSTFVSSVGEYVNRFEQQIKDYTGAKYAVACANGTSALHIALLLAGVKQNDLVICQPLTFIATCNALSYLGAEPVFVDIDKQTLGLSAEKLADFLEKETEIKENQCFFKKTNQKISACVPMHTFGHPTEIDKILEICKKYYINLIEDSAESLGSVYQGKQTGTFGLLGIYSLNGNKTITSGGGGVIVTNDEFLGKKAKHLTTQAKIPHAWEFAHDQIGYNYRMPNLNAAMAVAQMEKLDEFIENKRQLAEIYADFFEKTPFKFVTEPKNSRSIYWLNAILLKDRTERELFLEFMNKNGVMTRPSWQLMNELKMFENCHKANLENAIEIQNRLVNLPSSVRI